MSLLVRMSVLRPFLRANSITGGLVKGALSVAASAYKALFTGQSGPEQVAARLWLYFSKSCTLLIASVYK